MWMSSAQSQVLFENDLADADLTESDLTLEEQLYVRELERSVGQLFDLETATPMTFSFSSHSSVHFYPWVVSQVGATKQLQRNVIATRTLNEAALVHELAHLQSHIYFAEIFPLYMQSFFHATIIGRGSVTISEKIDSLEMTLAQIDNFIKEQQNARRQSDDTIPFDGRLKYLEDSRRFTTQVLEAGQDVLKDQKDISARLNLAVFFRNLTPFLELLADFTVAAHFSDWNRMGKAVRQILIEKEEDVQVVQGLPITDYLALRGFPEKIPNSWVNLRHHDTYLKTAALRVFIRKKLGEPRKDDVLFIANLLQKIIEIHSQALSRKTLSAIELGHLVLPTWIEELEKKHNPTQKCGTISHSARLCPVRP